MGVYSLIVSLPPADGTDRAVIAGALGATALIGAVLRRRRRGQRRVPIGVVAVTRDGVEVELLVTAVLRVVGPAPVDPIGTAVARVHNQVLQEVAGMDFNELMSLQETTWHTEDGVVVEELILDGIIAPHAKYRSQT
ncbi:hypothetical protein [Kribbella sp. NPDC051770]|uniref:hypothetical protein n=1 Tax=Kribbella sp. NPDC051770 TaxID=3155413 RepID=UPI003449D199